MSDREGTITQARLVRLHAGDRAALEEMLADHLDWIRAQVAVRLGKRMLELFEGEDVVQQAFVGFLSSGRKFVVNDPASFRALMLQIVENTIRKQYRDAHRKKRDAARAVPMPSGSVVDLSAGITRPSAAASREEHRAWVLLALELIDVDAREVIELREWQGLSFAQIAESLGVTEDAARMRFNRALQALAQTLRATRQGQLPAQGADEAVSLSHRSKS